MNKYKIGDTVWTRKRGKCEVVRIFITGIFTTTERPYLIVSESGRRYMPKAENLYPSEAAMNKAKVVSVQITGEDIIRLTGKVIDRANRRGLWDGSEFIKPDPIQPKFKVGDAVYLRGGKWTIMERYWSGTECRYNVLRPLTSDSDNLLAGITESDLRLWKETVLTHCLQIDGKTWYESDWKALAYKSIKYLGNIVKHDTFLVESHGGNLNLFRGIKGDDIEQTK